MATILDSSRLVGSRASEPARRDFATIAKISRRLRSGAHVGIIEIVALEEQRGSSVLCHCVSKAIAEVELCRMASALAVAREGSECGAGFLVGDRDRLDAG